MLFALVKLYSLYHLGYIKKIRNVYQIHHLDTRYDVFDTLQMIVCVMEHAETKHSVSLLLLLIACPHECVWYLLIPKTHTILASLKISEAEIYSEWC